MAYGSSLDQVGTLTKTVEDTRIVFNAIKGKDALDSTSVNVEDTNQSYDVKNLVIGIPREYFVKGADPKDYFSTLGNITDFTNMDLTTEANQKAVLRQALTDQQFDSPDIEDEIEIDLGFDTADYLPEDFDAHQVYFDLNGVDYIEEDLAIEWDTKEYLPKEFNAYAYPTDLQSINFIDGSDTIEVGFDTQKYLPLNFNAFTKL
jgi:hypothetical protein